MKLWKSYFLTVFFLFFLFPSFLALTGADSEVKHNKIFLTLSILITTYGGPNLPSRKLMNNIYEHKVQIGENVRWLNISKS